MIKPVILIILDGWGIAPAGPGNAISLASLPNFNRLWASFPHGKLLASGEPVGLPHGEKGNSETGHLNLGAGRIVYQDLPRINMSIADGSFFENEAFLAAIEHVKKHNSGLHLMGLIGQGGVHSSNDHLFALLQLAANSGLKKVYLHLFTDGRDSPPTSAISYLSQVEEELKKRGVGKIATISGRYFAMDRDNRWERTQKTYEAMVSGKGVKAQSAQEAINNAYNQQQTDEFIQPTVILENGQPVSLINDNDGVIFYNYRIDRPRQLAKAFVLRILNSSSVVKKQFDPYAEKYFKKNNPNLPLPSKTFTREKVLKNLFFTTMTEYERDLPTKAAFPPFMVKMPLSRVLAENNLRQLRLCETEKERFVTYYFNGQREDPCAGEDWLTIPSLKISTYDQKPQMSALEITKTVLEKINLGLYDFILINFANPDMVGHTGIIEASISALETIDDCLGKIVNSVLAVNGACLITADHGNVEEMINLVNGGIDTEHSANPVPLIIIDKNHQNNPMVLPNSILADVAPTILKLFNIPKPNDFSGRSLI